MLPSEPRTVKPRKPTRQPWLPIVVVTREPNMVFTELTGECHSWDALPDLFRSHPPSIVVSLSSGWLLADLEKLYATDPAWQYRITPVKRERWNPDPARRPRKTIDVIVNYFGWKGESKKRGHWHYPLDPSLFSQSMAIDLLGTDGPLHGRLLAWGKDVREWCHANNLHMAPTNGGLGGQLLRDPRWYPDPRRKVPKATNARARTVLPGNHYRLYWPEHKPVDATYLDMSSAHHNAALTTRFPCSNGLYARGHFKTADPTDTTIPTGKSWTPKGHVRYDTLIASHGLLQVRLNVPALKSNQFPPPYMETMGRRRVFIYTNEIPTILALGGIIEGIDAAWLGHPQDAGLNQYAAYALTETATMTEDRKRWCKATLLSTYGNLAAKPRTAEWAYRTGAGQTRRYPTGPTTIMGQAYIDDQPQEMGHVNVIHRGMIEAETRCQVLTMARHLTSLGHTVLSIYADAIMVRSGPALPLLPPPWRIESHLSRVRFFNATAFQSATMTKLPGIGRGDRERARRILIMQHAAAERGNLTGASPL